MTMPKYALRIGLVAALVLALSALTFHAKAGLHVTAYFDQFKGIYVGDDVTVRGVAVGKVTGVEPQADRVKVELRIDTDIHIPADVRAAVVAQSLVSVRAVALGPVARRGAALADGAVIPESRTSIPVEWDDIKKELVTLSTALGPHGANRDGATNRLITTGADLLRGQGGQLNTTIQDLSKAMTTLSDNGDNLFATVRNLQVFTAALRGSDAEMRLFNRRLAVVASSLNADRQGLVAALSGLSRAFGEVNTFLKGNRKITVSTLKNLRSTTSVMARDRQYIADLLQVAPTAMSNFYNILDPRGRDGNMLTGQLAAANLQAPAQIICGALLSLGGDRIACQNVIGPLAQYFSSGAPPIGIGGVQSSASGQGGTVEPGGRSASTSPSTTPQSAPSSPSTNLLGSLLEGLGG